MSERTYKKETVVEGPNGVVQSAKWFSGVRYRGRWNELPERRVGTCHGQHLAVCHSFFPGTRALAPQLFDTSESQRLMDLNFKM